MNQGSNHPRKLSCAVFSWWKQRGFCSCKLWRRWQTWTSALQWIFRCWTTERVRWQLKVNLNVVLASWTLELYWSHLSYTGYLYNQSVMRTAAIVLDIVECFHTGVRELLVIRAQRWLLGKDFVWISTGLSKNPFSPDIKNTPGFVIGTDAKPVFLRR